MLQYIEAIKQDKFNLSTQEELIVPYDISSGLY